MKITTKTGNEIIHFLLTLADGILFSFISFAHINDPALHEQCEYSLDKFTVEL